MSGPKKEPLETFWNRASVVHQFAGLAVPAYWREYFEAHRAKNCRVLDLGCGGGRNTRMLAEFGYNVDACDSSEPMVQETQRQVAGFHPVPRVRVGSMLSLPYDPVSFDVVLANGVLHNVSDEQEFHQALGEIARVLRPSGALCLNMFTSKSVDPGLIPKAGARHVFITEDGLDMLLAPTDLLVQSLQEHGFRLDGTVEEYDRAMDVGIRSVMRGVFLKE
jgi:SAM-dependent methyltransferase